MSTVQIDIKTLNELLEVTPEAYKQAVTEILHRVEETNNRADAMEEICKEEQQKYHKLREEHRELEEKYFEMGDELKLLTDREEEVLRRERNLNLTISEMRASNAEEITAKIMQLTEKVFGHPRVTVSKGCSVNGYGEQGSISTTSSETVTTIEGKE